MNHEKDFSDYPDIYAGFRFVSGFFVRFHSGSVDQTLQRRKSLNELRLEMQEAERLQLLTLVNGTYNLRSKDEGGLFRSKIGHYLEGAISNSAARIRNSKHTAEGHFSF